MATEQQDNSRNGSHEFADRRPMGVVVACLGTWVTALTVAVCGVASAIAGGGHGRFSAGIAVMLLCYAGLVAGVGWAGWRRLPGAQGLLAASGLIHLMVVLSLVRAGSPPWTGALGLLAVAVLAGALVPASGLWLREGRS